MPNGFTLNQYYHMRITAVGNYFRYYLDDMTTPLLTCTDANSYYSSGQIGFRVLGTHASWANDSLTSPQ